MAERYHLEKCLWTEEDFKKMGFHDCQIHAIEFQPISFKLLLDIDYIFAWVEPNPNEVAFNFWIAPATLVFENVNKLTIHIEPSNNELQIEDISQRKVKYSSNPEFIDKEKIRQWTLNCFQGEIKFFSTGFKMYVRSTPQLTQKQVLNDEDRKGISFLEQVVNQESLSQ